MKNLSGKCRTFKSKIKSFGWWGSSVLQCYHHVVTDGNSVLEDDTMLPPCGWIIKRQQTENQRLLEDWFDLFDGKVLQKVPSRFIANQQVNNIMQIKQTKIHKRQKFVNQEIFQ